MRKPVPGGVTPHGAWLYPRRGGSHTHAGVDLAGRQGTEVHAPADGRVVLVDTKGARGSGWHGYAPCVVFQTADGLYHLLAHLESEGLPLTTEHREGDVLGRIGPARHVHWELRRKLRPAPGELPYQISLDPLAWLRGELRPFDPAAQAAAQEATRHG